MKSLYKIEQFWEYSDKPEHNKWKTLFPFDCMQKSFALGAWAMLKSYYHQKHKHRLLKDGVVVEECSKQTIKVN
jgi:muramidase (phage lysozyme)